MCDVTWVWHSVAFTAIVSVVIIDSGLLYAVVGLTSVDVLCVCMRKRDIYSRNRWLGRLAAVFVDIMLLRKHLYS